MGTSLRKFKDIRVVPLCLFLVTALVFVDVATTRAHSPHDTIDSLVLSPTYALDKTLFVAMSSHLRKSTDGGFSWKELVNGLDNRHAFSSIAISPLFRMDKTLFVSSKGDGIYRTKDGGSSWVKVNNGLDNPNIGLLWISPDYDANSIVLAAGSQGGLYRTQNAGDHWYPVMDKDIPIKAISGSAHQRKNFVLAGDRNGFLYLSTDMGETWQQSYQFRGAGAIISMAISPNTSTDGTFFIGTEKGGVFKTVDEGSHFVHANNGLTDKAIRSIQISPEYYTDSTVFASTWYTAVFKSNDGGNSWQLHDEKITSDQQADSAQYKSPHFRDLRLSNGFAEDKTIFLAGFDGLFTSRDAGHNWKQMETLPVRLIMDLALSPANKHGTTVALTTYGGGAYTTDDEGRSWSINNRGLNSTRLSDIVFAPDANSNNTLFSASRGFLLKTTNGGEKWERIALASRTWKTRVYSILRKLRVPNALRKQILTKREREKPFPTVIALSPDFATDKTLYFGTRYHGLYRSVNAGLDNACVWDAMRKTIVSLVISPDFSSDRTIFAAIRGNGLYRTVDAGNAWQQINNGLPFVDNEQQAAKKRASHQEDIKLVISPHFKTDKTLFAASSRGLFKTTDGGNVWKNLQDSVLDKDAFIIAIAISPNYTTDQELIVSAKGKGLFRSNDGGMTFTALASDLINNNHRIEMLEFSESYATDTTIYAASYEELFRSTDGGVSWTVTARPTRYENHRDVIEYEGEWNITKGDDFSARSVSQSNAPTSKATLDFVGTGIAWIGTTSTDQGIAKIYLDGNYITDIDQFSETSNPIVELYAKTGLSHGPHTITVESANTANPRSTGHRLVVDAFDVITAK